MRKSILVSTLAAFALVAGGAARAQSIGAPACDDFLAKYAACYAKAPANVREMGKSAEEEMRASFKAMAADPQTKGGLDGICKGMFENMKPHLNGAPINCGL